MELLEHAERGECIEEVFAHVDRRPLLRTLLDARRRRRNHTFVLARFVGWLHLYLQGQQIDDLLETVLFHLHRRLIYSQARSQNTKKTCSSDSQKTMSGRPTSEDDVRSSHSVCV